MTPPSQVPTRIFTAAEAEGLLNGPLSRWERDLDAAAPDLARSVVHWAVRAGVAEEENDRLRELVRDAYIEGWHDAPYEVGGGDVHRDWRRSTACAAVRNPFTPGGPGRSGTSVADVRRGA